MSHSSEGSTKVGTTRSGARVGELRAGSTDLSAEGL
jgi:hypothetical protein